jgi:hypothetical protein
MQVSTTLLEEHPGYRLTLEGEARGIMFLLNAGTHPRTYHGHITQRTAVKMTNLEVINVRVPTVAHCTLHRSVNSRSNLYLQFNYFT